MRAEQQTWSPRVACGQRAEDVVVRAPTEREWDELDGQPEGAQLGGHVVASRPVSLGCGDGMPDSLECAHLASQTLGQRGALTAG
jgi:hypothetical protein